MSGRLRTAFWTVVARVPPGAVVILLAACSLLVNFRNNLACANGHPEPDVAWTHACYSDVIALYSARGLSDGHWPYLDQQVEYPVLIGALMALVGLPVHALGHAGLLDAPAHALGFETVDEGVVFYWATAGVLGLLALVVTGALLRLRRDRPWDVLRWSLAPSLMLASTINWDLLAVCLSTLALLAWSRSRPGWAGVLLGLGAAAKLYPLLILGPLVVLCLRAGTPRARRAALVLSSRAMLAWLAVNLPLALATRDGWAWAYRFSQDRWIDWGSLWYVLDHVAPAIGAGWLIGPLWGDVATLNRSSGALFALCCVGIAALIWSAPQRPRVASMAFLVVAAFLLTNKVWSPQFVLWLLPLAVLARPRWDSLLVWQAAEVGYLFSVMRLVLGNRDDYALSQASVARWLTVAVLAGLVVTEALRPGRDVVRDGTGNDPDAGPLADPAPLDDPTPLDDPAPSVDAPPADA